MTSSQTEPGATGGLEYKWKVLIATVFGVFMIMLNSTVVNVALHTFQDFFQAQTNEVQWTISIYNLSLGIVTPLAGFLADRFGIKRVYTGALALFVLGSLLCSVAPNLPLLIVARMIQALGGGIAMPLGTALLFAAFPPEQRGMALGIFGVAVVFGPAIGPMFGGWLIDLGLWRWIFAMNIPFGLLGMAISWLFLNEQTSDAHSKLDLPGIVLSMIGFGAVLYGASRAGVAGVGWGAPEVLIAIGVGLAALAVFAVVELRLDDPLLDLRLFRIPTFLIANVIGWVGVVAMFGSEFLLPLYLQVLRERPAFEAGLMMLPLAVASGVVLPLAGRAFDRIGPRPLIVAGFVLLMLNTWQLAHLDFAASLWYIAGLMAMRGVAMGMLIQTTQATALRDVPMPKLARGSSLINATRQTFMAIGVALLATVLVSEVTVGTPAAGDQIALFRTQYLAGLSNAYMLTFYASFASLIMALWLPGWPAPYVSTEDEGGESQVGVPAAMS